MKRRNSIEAATLQSWLAGQTPQFATDTVDGQHMTFSVRVSPLSFIVKLGDEVLYDGPCITLAVQAWNEAVPVPSGNDAGPSDSATAVQELPGPASKIISELHLHLANALSFIEHSEANRGKCTSEAEWEANVHAYRRNGPSSIAIGRSYTNKAAVDLVRTREVLQETEKLGLVPKGGVGLNPEGFA